MTDRLEFAKWARDARLSESCLKRHRIFDYHPGHVRYQFGHYPTQNPYHPTDEDWKLLDLYCEKGLKVVHVWWWSDFCGFLGKGMLEPINEKGLRLFIDECHRRRLKAIPYVSPGYMDIRSPVYRPEWGRGAGNLAEAFYDLDRLCPGSPGHRARFLSSVERLMDDYGFDGLYWDGGFGLERPGCSNSNHDKHIHFAEISTEEQIDVNRLRDDVTKGGVNEPFCALWNEFLCEIYARVKIRGGFIVAHIESDLPSPFLEKCWDYNLVGESVGDVLTSVEKTKLYDPYLLRFNDWSRIITDWKQRDLTPHLELVPRIENLSMAAYVPYLQFPWLEDGCYGQQEDIFNIPGVSWKNEWDLWAEWIKAQAKAGLAPLMGASFAAGSDRYFKYLGTYRQMTTENTVAYLEVTAMAEERFPTTEGKRRVSVFVNDSLWVAIGYLGAEPQKVTVRPLQAKDKGQTLVLKPETLTVLRYHDLASRPEIIQDWGQDR